MPLFSISTISGDFPDIVVNLDKFFKREVPLILRGFFCPMDEPISPGEGGRLGS
jgi:hypothetical protein